MQYAPGTIQGALLGTIDEIYSYENWRGQRYSVVVSLHPKLQPAQDPKQSWISIDAQASVYEYINNSYLDIACPDIPDNREVRAQAFSPKPLLAGHGSFRQQFLLSRP
jgi:hypothetical protein